MWVDKKTCRKCKNELAVKRGIDNGTVVHSGYCGKSITVDKYGVTTYSDDADCSPCPSFGNPVEQAEKSLNKDRKE